MLQQLVIAQLLKIKVMGYRLWDPPSFQSSGYYMFSHEDKASWSQKLNSHIRIIW